MIVPGGVLPHLRGPARAPGCPKDICNDCRLVRFSALLHWCSGEVPPESALNCCSLSWALIS